MMNFNIQRFSENDLDVLNIDIESEDESLPEEDRGAEPEHKTISEPVSMPSQIPVEAWRNVEEMLVSLSNNVRTGQADVIAKIKGMIEKFDEKTDTIDELLKQIKDEMNGFNDLLQSAVVEESPKNKEEEKKEPPKSKGYLSRRKK